jgi:hypothetical protein
MNATTIAGLILLLVWFIVVVVVYVRLARRYPPNHQVWRDLANQLDDQAPWL